MNRILRLITAYYRVDNIRNLPNLQLGYAYLLVKPSIDF